MLYNVTGNVSGGDNHVIQRYRKCQWRGQSCYATLPEMSVAGTIMLCNVTGNVNGQTFC